MEMLESVWIPSLNTCNDVVQVDDTLCQVELPKTILHQMLECFWHTAQSKWHLFALIKPEVDNGECHILFGLRAHLDLPET